MKVQSISLLILSILSFSCSSDDSVIIESFWVDSQRVSCTSEGVKMCYKVQENYIIDENVWIFFYDGIEGFDQLYEEGFIYNISVIEIHIDNPPADSSSSHFILNKIISKELDE